MIFLLDGKPMPMFGRMSVAKDDALNVGRGLAGNLSVDRSYDRDIYTFEYDFIDIETYNMIKTLYDRHFSEGVFFQLTLTDTDYPINTLVFISPGSIVPRFAGRVLEGYKLQLIQK